MKLGAAELVDAQNRLLKRLLGLMHPDGFWPGYLSSSALSTATAISALSVTADPQDRDLVGQGLEWLSDHQNPDGGWGDTTDSPSNLSTTLLALAAFALSGAAADLSNAVESARAFIQRSAGDTPAQVAGAVTALYGEDRTFATPILANCALAGLVPWQLVPPLAAALAAVPRSLQGMLRLEVVSYALPALIAIGQLVASKRSSSMLRRAIRSVLLPPLLNKLQRIQPDSGGYLEATPLTSFVAMSLAPTIGRDHPVVRKCLTFLRDSCREDGSWPIDTNLSVGLTSAVVSALACAGAIDTIDAARTRNWIAARQSTAVHPYTGTSPGGWGWTHLSGSVPDVDDTAGAIVALSSTGGHNSIEAGVRWLLGVQNADGGWPTFCRGWGKLPFDRSAPDLTAHALRALRRADGDQRSARAIERGLAYLSRSQRRDGSWVPLWFGSQCTTDKTNPVLGTARVLRALEEVNTTDSAPRDGVAFLVEAQNADGGWGAAHGFASSIEETSQALAALAAWRDQPGVSGSLARGTELLLQQIATDDFAPTPIGLYFASLWYSEALYPIVWALEALGRLQSAGGFVTLSPGPSPSPLYSGERAGVRGRKR